MGEQERYGPERSDSSQAHQAPSLEHPTETVKLPFCDGKPSDHQNSKQEPWAATGATLKRGASLGRYTILRALGSGGMGYVYSAYDPELDRRIAIKILRAELPHEDRDVTDDRLRHEAQTVARLMHPNVVTVHDIGRVKGQFFIAMEEITGRSLREWLKDDRSWQEIVEVFLQAGRGLAAAHRAGFVHLDFKPGNVMIDHQGRVKIVDFGLALAPQQVRNNELGTKTAATRTEDILGTPAYMSPEQKSGQAVDARSDQFSFCVALYEALYGAPPRIDDSASTLPAEIRPPIPNRIRLALLRGLSPKPKDRFDTLEELLDVIIPKPRWVAYKAALIACAVVIVMGILGWRQFRADPIQPCQGANRHLEGLWDESRKTQIQQIFLATDKPYAAASWNQVETILDTYTRTWVGLHTEACQATHLHGEQSSALLDQQMACLDRRLAEVKALGEVFQEADAQIVQNAVNVASRLTPINSCADRSLLLAETRIDPRIASEVREGQNQLARVKILETAGKYPQALKLAQDVESLGQQLAYTRLAAEAEVRIGFLHGRLGDLTSMGLALREAVATGLAADHEEALAEALIAMIIHSYMLGELQDAQFWGQFALAAMENRQGMERLQAERHIFLGLVSLGLREEQGAIEHFRASLDIDPNLTPVKLAALKTNIGVAYQNLGAKSEALALFREAEDAVVDSLGKAHPNLASVLESQGDVLRELGSLKEAEDVYRRSISIYETADLADHFIIAALVGLGRTLIKAGRSGEALIPLERAVNIARKSEGDPMFLARALFALARADQLTRKEQVKERIAEARAIFERLGERAALDLDGVDTWIAEQKGAIR